MLVLIAVCSRKISIPNAKNNLVAVDLLEWKAQCCAGLNIFLFQKDSLWFLDPMRFALYTYTLNTTETAELCVFSLSQSCKLLQ